MVRNEPTFVRVIVDSVLKQFGETLFVTKTVRELLFDGYDDALLSFVANLNISAINIPFDKFGWFYAVRKRSFYKIKNNLFIKNLKKKEKKTNFSIPFYLLFIILKRNGSETYDGIFNMHTGVDNISDLGVLDKWNYSNETNHWSGECNDIRGTTGELWPPLNRDETVEIFAPDICT